MNDFGLTDAQMFPLLDEAGAANLRRLREHPHAPRYNWRTGDRLDAAGLANVRAYAEKVKPGPAPWAAERLPPWVMPFVTRCRRDVPFYRDREPWSDDAETFHALPLARRDDVRKQPWAFVPDGQPTDPLITYTTSGTTGTRLQIPATAELPARYLPLIEAALSRVGVTLERGRRVAIVQVCAQTGTVVQCSVSSYLGGAGFAKINLDPADWYDPNAPLYFLDDCDAQLITGDPFALWRLTHLPLRARPRAILSAGTSLSAGLRKRLAAQFRCPVIDMYSMNETGPIAFSFADGVCKILTPELYVEILDPHGRPCAPGERGEITVTGGVNDCLPLVRYATGDFASMEFAADDNAMPRLRGLEGRPPVCFRGADGRWISSVDVSTALGASPLPYLALHQRGDGGLVLRTSGDDDGAVARAVHALARLFGDGQAIDVLCDDGPVLAAKPIRYSTDLPDATASA